MEGGKGQESACSIVSLLETRNASESLGTTLTTSGYTHETLFPAHSSSSPGSTKHSPYTLHRTPARGPCPQSLKVIGIARP